MRWIQGHSKIFNIQVMKGSRRNRGVALLILNPGRRWKWVVNITLRPLYSRQRKWHAVNTKLGGPQSKSGRFVEERINCLVAGGIRRLDRPARSPVTTPTTLSRNLWKHLTYVNKHEFSKMYCSLRHATEERTWRCTTLL
jgi:hypothetical protein